MRLSTAFLLFLGTSILSAVPPSQLPYSQNDLPAATFDPRGTWTLHEIAGYSDSYQLGKLARRRLLGTTLEIRDADATFWNKRVMQWKRFPTTRIGQETYDTQSREFWFDFRTDPQSLHLPRYVTSVDLELGQIVAAGTDRTLFKYEGVWFSISRTKP